MISGENKEKEKLKETMKTHQVIKPHPRTFSSHSLLLNEKHSFVKPIVTVSTKDASVAKDCNIDSTMQQINGDGDCAMWWESLLNLSNDKIGSCYLLQEEGILF